MKLSRNFINLTIADFIVRSGYQMGKTPLLPILAASLGASDVLLGSIVSISTLTGMVSKPIFGFLSDRQGRRWWILLGTLFFAVIPFFYQFVHTPAQLVLIRVIHGTATAIYGPVTVAFIAERSSGRTAEYLGWFDMARSGGYIVGPLVAGWLLLFFEPAAVFTIIGLISCAAFVPVAMIQEDEASLADNASRPLAHTAHRTHLRMRQWFRSFADALRVGAQTPAVWLSGIMEATIYVALYAAKAFLPIYALTAGYNTVQIGLFFSLQESVHLLLKPFGGGIGDRIGHARTVALGMISLALALPLLTVADTFVALLGLAMVVGVAQALIFPNTVALVSDQIDGVHLGAGMGLVGTFENAGKVAGPVLGGLMIAQLSYQGMFWSMGALMGAGALLIWLRAARPRRQRVPENAALHSK